MYKVEANYSDLCFCKRPALISASPHIEGKNGRWNRKGAMLEYARTMHLDVVGFDKAGALAYLLVPCAHRSKQAVRLEVHNAF